MLCFTVISYMYYYTLLDDMLQNEIKNYLKQERRQWRQEFVILLKLFVFYNFMSLCF